jgi:hypothetical protein
MTSADAELALLLAGTEARRKRTLPRIRALAASADADTLLRYLGERRLLGLIGSRLEKLVPHVAASVSEGAAAARKAARLQAMAIDAVTVRLARQCEEAGIPALPLKGPRLARALYGDAGLRASSDVDLLVPAGGLERAVALTRAEGYEPRTGPVRRDGLPDLHVELEQPRLPPVELHWRVHWYESAFSRTSLAHSEPDRDGIRRAQPRDDLAMLLLFFARDGFHGLRHAADIAAWWDRHGASYGARGILDEHASRYPELAPALRAAAVSAERHGGVPAGALLSNSRTPGRRGQLAVALGDWAAEGDRDQLAANVDLVDGLLGPRGLTRDFLRRQLLTPPVRTLGPDGSASLWARGVHAAKTLGRFALALRRVRGGRAWRPLPPST